jgi:hypothetical protein
MGNSIYSFHAIKHFLLTNCCFCLKFFLNFSHYFQQDPIWFLILFGFIETYRSLDISSCLIRSVLRVYGFFVDCKTGILYDDAVLLCNQYSTRLPVISNPWGGVSARTGVKNDILIRLPGCQPSRKGKAMPIFHHGWGYFGSGTI